MKVNVTSRAVEELARWRGPRPSFALMGEFSAGKSELLNLLLGRALLPTQVTATDLPAIWMTYAATERYTGLDFDGTLRPMSGKDLTAVQTSGLLAIRIETNAAILKRTDIIDTPGISDPRMPAVVAQTVSGVCDFIVWCSPANQAWRQTERAFWKALPEASRRNGILALTRADTMRRPQDLDKVVRRCKADAGDDFAAIHPIATLAALHALRPGAPDSEWSESGAEALTDTIMATIAKLARGRAAAKANDPPAKAAPHKAAPEKTPAAKALPKLPGDIADAFQHPLPEGVGLDQVLAAIREVETRLDAQDRIDSHHREVLRRIVTVEVRDGLSGPGLMRQIRQEWADFRDGPWCELGQVT